MTPEQSTNLRPLVYRACLEETDGDEGAAEEATNVIMRMDEKAICDVAEHQSRREADRDGQLQLLAVLDAALEEMQPVREAALSMLESE